MSPARLKRAWQIRQADCLSLLAAVCALGVKLLIDAVFRRSPYYAWGHDILSLKPALPARVLENLELLRDTVIPYVWGLKAPLNPPWISLACLGLVLASALVCLLSGYPRWRQKPLSWLRENFPLYAYGSGLLLLLAGLVFSDILRDRFSSRYLYIAILWYPFYCSIPSSCCLPG